MKKRNFLLSAVFVALFYTGHGVPSHLHRFARSWEAEACSSRNLRNQDRYICTQDGKIQCLDGWIGDLCQVPMCGAECDPQHGYCVKPGECKCNLGYHGPSCRDCVKLPGCQNGYCKKSFECRCEEGWSGMFCNTPECDENCERNNGFCAGPGKCECKRGYSGPNCTECSTLPGCKNGSCTKPLECVCDEGWTGIFCNEPVCADNCSREYGTCYHPGECRCRLGYQGEGCRECVAYPGCVNGDCAEPYDCNCKPGWTGHLCDQPEVELAGDGVRGGRCQPVGSFVCMNRGEDVCQYYGNGTMVGQPECKCKPGYGGKWCEQQEPDTADTNEAIEPRHAGDKTEAQEETSEAAGSEVANNEVAGNEEADSNVASTEVAGSKVAGSESALQDPIAETEHKVVAEKLVGSEQEDIKEQPEKTSDDDEKQLASGIDVDIDKDKPKEDPNSATENPTAAEVAAVDVDWSKKSEKSGELNTDKKPETSSENKAVTEESEKSDENVSELGVRAIHSDVFNSGKLIEIFGSDEGLQGFHHF